MSRVKVVGALLILSLIGVACFQAFGRQAPAPPQQAGGVGTARPRMKYMTREVLTNSVFVGLLSAPHAQPLTEKLNDAEAQGWELVQVVPFSLVAPSGGQAKYFLIYRRPADAKD